MESSFGFRARPQCLTHHHHHHPHRHHHYHHHRHLCHCRHHQFCSVHSHHYHHHCNCHFLVFPRFAPLPLQDRDHSGSYLSQNDLNLQANVVFQEPENNELEEQEEEDDDDPVFVLTDEWKEFFAKSEAKRKLEKQQAKKKDKH